MRFFFFLSFLDYVFTALGFHTLKYPPFNPIAVFIWENLGLFGWTLEKILSVGIVTGLVKLYLWLSGNYFPIMSHYWVIFAVSCLNLFLIGAILQEWYFLGWIPFMPNSISIEWR